MPELDASALTAFYWASFANLAAALKGKLGKDVTHKLKVSSPHTQRHAHCTSHQCLNLGCLRTHAHLSTIAEVRAWEHVR